MTTQRTFDFNRAAQLRLLDDLDLVGAVHADGSPVHARRVKGFLKAVDSAAHGGQQVKVSQQRLAEIAGMSVPTIRRAQREAVRLGLVVVSRSEFESTYAVNWIAVLDGLNCQPTAHTPPITATHPSDQGDRTPGSRRTTPSITVIGPMDHGDPSISHGFPCLPKKHHGFAGGWPFEITEEILGKPESVASLFKHAVACQWQSESDELRFFTLAASIRRRFRAGLIESAGAAFTAAVKRKKTSERWAWGTADDEDVARRMITQAAGGDAGCAPSVAVPAAVHQLAAAMSAPAEDWNQKRTQAVAEAKSLVDQYLKRKAR